MAFLASAASSTGLHAAPASNLLTAIGAHVNYILAAVYTEWYQATAKVTAEINKLTIQLLGKEKN